MQISKDVLMRFYVGRYRTLNMKETRTENNDALSFLSYVKRLFFFEREKKHFSEKPFLFFIDAHKINGYQSKVF